MNRDVVHKHWFDDRHAQVLYDKDMGMFLVEMYEKTEFGMKKHATIPMVTGQEYIVKGMQKMLPKTGCMVGL